MISEECAIALVRAKIARAQEMVGVAECLPGCKGWDVFEAHRQSGVVLEIERCDECCWVGEDWFVRDDEVALLPEAQAKLKELQ